MHIHSNEKVSPTQHYKNHFHLTWFRTKMLLKHVHKEFVEENHQIVSRVTDEFEKVWNSNRPTSNRFLLLLHKEEVMCFRLITISINNSVIPCIWANSDSPAWVELLLILKWFSIFQSLWIHLGPESHRMHLALQFFVCIHDSTSTIQLC